MEDREIIIGHVINVIGMIGVVAGIVLFTFVIVLLLFRRGFGFDCKLLSLVLVTRCTILKVCVTQAEANRPRMDAGYWHFETSTDVRYSAAFGG